MEVAIIQCNIELSKEDWQSLVDELWRQAQKGCMVLPQCCELVYAGEMKMLIGKPGEIPVE